MPITDIVDTTGTSTQKTDEQQTQNENIQDNGWSEQSLDYDPIKQEDVFHHATVNDHETPIIFLFGPPECGKTMTLVRLSRWLHVNGYTVSADESFKDARDAGYKRLCDEFPNIIYSDFAADRTRTEEFLLVQVRDNKQNKICQIVETPGEDLFNVKAPGSKDFTHYTDTIMGSNAKKVYLFFTQPNWNYHTLAQQYVDKIKQGIVYNPGKFRKHCDKAIIIFNQADVSGAVNNPDAMKKQVETKYPGLFELFKNDHPISRLWREYNCHFIPFVTGSYDKDYKNAEPGKATPKIYTAGADIYPAALWNAIQKCL